MLCSRRIVHVSLYFGVILSFFFSLWFYAEETFRFQGVGIFAQCKGNLSVTNLAKNFPFSAVHLLVFKNCNLNIH